MRVCQSYVSNASFQQQNGAQSVVIAAGTTDLVGTINAALERLGLLDERAIKVMHVSPWDFVTPALNALVREAAHRQASHILFQSVEVLVNDTAAGLAALLRPFERDANTLVVGSALEGHLYCPPTAPLFAGPAETPSLTRGGQCLNGATSPWNTFALWDVARLGRVGFLPVSDGLTLGPTGVNLKGGVEEVVAIVLLQKIFPEEGNTAYLVQVPELSWKTEWDDPGRTEFHAQKMASKQERAAAQLQAMGLGTFPAVVHHT
jgi:hypothetical protein